MSIVAFTYIRALAYRGEERREVQVHVVGLLKMSIYSSSAFEVRGGLAITAAAVV